MKRTARPPLFHGAQAGPPVANKQDENTLEDDGTSTLIDDEEEEEDFDFDNQVFFRTVWDPAKWDKCPRCEGGGFERVRLLRDAAIIIAGKGYAPFPCRHCGGMKYMPKASGERLQA